MLRRRRARLHVVLHVLRQPREQELEPGAIHLRLHRNLLPLRRARIPRKQIDLVRRQARPPAPSPSRRCCAAPPHRPASRESRRSAAHPYAAPSTAATRHSPRIPAAPQPSTPARPRTPRPRPAATASLLRGARRLRPRRVRATFSVSAASSSRNNPFCPASASAALSFSENVTSRCSNSGNAASARPTERRRFSRHSGHANPAAHRRHHHRQQRQARRRQSALRKRIGIQNQGQDNRREPARQTATSAAPRSARIQPQPLLHLLDVEVELARARSWRPRSWLLPLRTQVAAGHDRLRQRGHQ